MHSIFRFGRKGISKATAFKSSIALDNVRTASLRVCFVSRADGRTATSPGPVVHCQRK